MTSNNVMYSVIVAYGWLNDYSKDLIWYDFDDLQDTKEFYNYIKDYTKDDNIEYITVYKFINNINKMIELDFNDELVVA